MTSKNRELLLALLAALTLLPGAAWALKSDREKPVHIEADDVELDDKRGISVYRGDVVITQGTMRITGDRVTVYTTPGGDLDHAVSVGKPATYKQRPDNKPDDVHARSSTMEYFAAKDTVTLTGDAHLRQGPNTFDSEKIIYDVANDHVDAGKQTGGDRVRITIHPESKPKPGESKSSEPKPSKP